MNRPRGLSARLRLTLSYAGFLCLAGILVLATIWVSLLRHLPGVPTEPPGATALPLNRYFVLHALAPATAATLAFLLGFGLLGGWVLASRMLAPLTRITQAARTAGQGSLSHRIRMPGRQDEFRELADAFDAMLEKLQAHVAEQQRFAANASHELRTPLAISHAMLDVARRDPSLDRDELIERLNTANRRAIDLTEALLLLSRGERGHFTRESVDLSLTAEEAAEALLPLAERRGVTLDVGGCPARTSGSAELLLRMVTNLVQNAIVHNLPGGGTVSVDTATGDACVVLRVSNTGRPLAPETLPTLLEPFQRGSERVRTDEHAGAGLGLAIVNSIVRAHHGTLELVSSPAGGLMVTVRLPAAPRAPEPARAPAGAG
ncbi:HAMP domain-containing histidine kinase [Kineosporia sp. J2-2]|uniref:histidine kinase n=1 Tax=Kineosporia corallincola TaxID=2835133 RepID=A0ABS5TLZ7_9ACTN|nr:HAMP domain-containing sensor histidine kinase [Kineosporia corallincola]MBT0772030.1 HAMP domain-containing histidine kinase [Kineosporia corallincola]